MTAGVRARPVPLWKNRDYVLLWSGQTVSIIGTQVSQLAFPLLVLALTGSPAQAGFVAAARTVPWLLFALPAGALVDRWDRKRTMILTSAGSAVALASITVAYPLGVLTIAQIVLVSFVEGTLTLVFGLAQTSALPHVVPKEQLPDAVAQQQAQYSVGSLIGPPLGGILYGIAHLLPFLVDAVSYAASSISLPFIQARFGGSSGAARRSLRHEIGEGMGWLWRHPLIRFMAFLTGGFNVTAGTTLLVIVLAQQQGVTPGGLGLIFAVAGVGGIVGAVIAPRIQRRFTFGQAIIGLSWLFALNTALLVAARSPVLIALVLISFELIAPSYDTVQYSYRLAVIPDRLQGRVNSVFRLISQGTRPLGLALTGIPIERAGIIPTILLFSAWLVIVALAATLNGHVRHAPALASAA